MASALLSAFSDRLTPGAFFSDAPSTRTITEAFPCEECGHEGTATYYHTVNAAESPEAAERVRSGAAFSYTCPQCGASYLLDFSMLYVDPERRFTVFWAGGEQADEDAEELFARFSDVEDAEKEGVMLRLNPSLASRQRVVSTPEDLMEKVAVFEAGLDDRLLELHKEIFAGILTEEEGVQVNGLAFERLDAATGEIVYTVYLDDEVESIAVARAGYDDLAANEDVVRYLAGEAYDFFIDSGWAQDALLAITGVEEA